MIYLLLFVHIYFTFKLKFIQKDTFKGIKYSFTPSKTQTGIGVYRAFASALGTTIGPGNIIGVAVAISFGGSGSVLWMWICGILAMSTKYAESYLSLKFKTKIGGSGVILASYGSTFLALLWSIFCAGGGLFMGAAVPSASLVSCYETKDYIVSFCLAALVVLTVCFGFKGIANAAALTVPVMSFAFTLFCIAVIVKNIAVLPSALSSMIKSAFLPSSFVGGALAASLKQGITRGLYTNESGLGTGGLMAAESGDTNIHMCSLSAMTTVFWDTVVMCAVTGFMFVCCGAKIGDGAQNILITAFSTFSFGKIFLKISMSVFVYATIIGWYYVSKKALSQFYKNTAIYDILYIAFVFFGGSANLENLYIVADFVNYLILALSVFALMRARNKINLYINNK